MATVSDHVKAGARQERTAASLQFEREEEARIRKPFDQQARANARLQQEVIEAERKLAAQELLQSPSTYIAENCTAYTGTASAEDVSKAIAAAVTEMHKILATHGIVIHESGLAKMIAVSNKNLHQFDSTSSTNLLTLFSYMDYLSMFEPADVSRPSPVEPEPVAVPEVGLTLQQQLDQQETMSHLGEKRGRAIATELLVDAAQGEFRRWKASVYAAGRDVTTEESSRMIQFMRENNINFTETGFQKAAAQVLGLMSVEQARETDAMAAYDLWRAGDGKFSSEREQRRMYLLIHRQHGCPAHETLYR